MDSDINNKLKNIKLMVLDVDGVLTDGTISYTDDDRETKHFNTQDGAGIKYWKRAGNEIAIITGRSSEAVARRAGELDINHVYQGAKDKLPFLEKILADTGIEASNTCYLGDDLPDIPAMLHVGAAFAVANATKETKDSALFVTKSSGGRGAVREVIEMILKAQGKWEKILQRYLPYLDEK